MASSKAAQKPNQLFVFGLVLSWGIFSALAVLVLAGMTIVSGLAAGVIVIGAFIVGHMLYENQLQQWERQAEISLGAFQDEKKRLEHYAHSLEQLVEHVAPILSRQVQTSRTHTEQEITVLTQRFAAMLDQISAIVSETSHTQDGRDVDAIFAEGRHALTQVLKALKEIKQVEHEVIEEVRKLSSLTGRLNEMAMEVRKVAEQINLLALNAAIEAARAGENGRGFAVVADEVRKLAGFSSTTGEKISSAVNDISAAMQATVKKSESSGVTEDKTINDAENSISTVLADLQTVLAMSSHNTRILQQNSGEVSAQISDVLTAFQFQDRVAQMLQHVEHNLEAMQSLIQQAREQRDTQELDVQQALAHMELNYTMPEEVMNHSTAGDNHAQVKHDDDLTFF
ncbi:MAG: methyl-accepting chemotaxis protein [Methylococcales bacterium]|nr:methyl-accepting chemotaxis protein [Methylococcales bacterium]